MCIHLRRHYRLGKKEKYAKIFTFPTSLSSIADKIFILTLFGFLSFPATQTIFLFCMLSDQAQLFQLLSVLLTCRDQVDASGFHRAMAQYIS